jgi:hypothetical protein
VTGRVGTLVAVRTKGLIVTVCGLLLVAAACSDDGKAQPAPLVEKSFAISQGDAICKSLVADIATLVGQFKSAHTAPSDADARDFLGTTLLPRIDRGIGSLHRVGEPTKDRVGFDNAILALDKDLSSLKLAVSADPIKVVNNPIPLFVTSAKLFVDYGFKECGKKA